MTDKLQFTAASDKDVFDLLMASRQKLSDSALRSIALRRGIIYSSDTPRERVISDISLLPHDYHSISDLIKKREIQKQEKMTWVTLSVELTRHEMVEIVNEYKKNLPADEEMNFQPRRGHDVFVKFAYNEIDYSKTRLIQKQRRDAEIEFISAPGTTTIRMPAVEKARSVVEQFRLSAERLRRENIGTRSVELTGLSSEDRSKFFVQLMRSMTGYDFHTVVNLRFASAEEVVSEGDLGVDIETDEQTTEEIVGIVSSVVLAGINLEQSDEYISLKRKGYYFTSAKWQSLQQSEPRDLLQFEASFDNGDLGTGFKYSVKVARRNKRTGDLMKGFEHLDPLRQPSLWGLMEKTALSVLDQIRQASAMSTPNAGEQQ